MTTKQSDRFSGCLLGLAAGDAVGTTVEFQPRGSFTPLTDMVGGGPFRLPAGAWTDDTSMALCLGYSLVEKGGFDPADQMDRYCAWRDEGYLSSTGDCFDVGVTVSGALSRYKAGGDPFSGSTDPYSAGNGSIMRLAPIPSMDTFSPVFPRGLVGTSEVFFFSSPSAAAAVVLARRANGWIEWKYKDGRTLDEVKRQ